MNTVTRRVVLAAIDQSAACAGVLDAAASLVSPDTEIHLVHVVPGVTELQLLNEEGVTPREEYAIDEARNFLDEIVNGARLTRALRVHGHLAAGEPATAILQMSTNLQAGIIVIGTHDYRGVRRLVLGSVSEQVAKRAQCPVLVVRPVNYTEHPEEITPACPDCLAVQASTKGAVLWCEPHRHHRRHAHVYHASQGARFGDGSMLVK